MKALSWRGARKAAVIVAAAVFLPAHMKLHTPAPRTSPDPDVQAMLDGGGLTSPEPCGDPVDIPMGAPSATYLPDSEVEIVVDNVISHGGQRFQIFVSLGGDMDFVEALVPSSALPGTVPYVLGGVSAAGTGLHRITVRLPPGVSEAASIRAFDNVNYFSCADVRIVQEAVFASGFETGDTSDWSQ